MARPSPMAASKALALIEELEEFGLTPEMLRHVAHRHELRKHIVGLIANDMPADAQAKNVA